jgi:hypothetical protein
VLFTAFIDKHGGEPKEDLLAALYYKVFIK